MPKYVYRCHQCEGEFEIRHSIGKSCEICKICNQAGEFTRIPSSVFLNKKDDKFGEKNKPGSVVKETIKEIREEISQERRNLSNRMYKPND
jgi:rRNA maturation endonuclease Nob1|tara:strand:+ start:44 stop:316 length:273 start_codon:yes stop_codon:yes gene_type:complete